MPTFKKKIKDFKYITKTFIFREKNKARRKIIINIRPEISEIENRK